MIIVRRTEDRRVVHHRGETKLSFREGDDADPLGSGFFGLRNIAEHWLPPGAGLVPDSTSDRLTYVVEGAVRSDPEASRADPVHAGCFELLQAKDGLRRAIVGGCESASARVLEVRLKAGAQGESQSKIQRERFCTGERRGVLRLIASQHGDSGSLKLEQDAFVLSVLLDFGQHVARELHDRHGWIHVIRGQIAVSDIVLREGDGAGFSGERSISLTAQTPCELLVVDLGAC